MPAFFLTSFLNPMTIARHPSTRPVISAKARIPEYGVTDLGVLPGMNASTPLDVNDRGQVVGQSGLGKWYGQIGSHPFLYDHGKMIDLGVRDGFTEAVATGINDNGWIAVTMRNLTGQAVQSQAYLWKDGTYRRLPGAKPFVGSITGEINNGNVLVGAYLNENGEHIAFVKNDSGMRRLKTIPGYAFMLPKRVNERGDIVGTADYASNGDLSQAIVILNGRLARALRSPAGKSSSGEGINNRGQAVGWFATRNHDANFNDITHGFLWDSRRGMIDIGSLGGVYCEANAINDQGVIVGEAQISGSADYHACVWIGGKAIDLNTRIPGRAGLQLKDAYAVNNRGRIACDGVVNGCLHAFLLTPH
jgi:probable HAF family extracellular repeat protein